MVKKKYGVIANSPKWVHGLMDLTEGGIPPRQGLHAHCHANVHKKTHEKAYDVKTSLTSWITMLQSVFVIFVTNWQN